MDNYTTPFKSHSVPFKATGIFYGIVHGVANNQLDISVPRMTGPDIVFSGIDYVDSGFTTVPSVGELVFVGFLEGRKDDLVVLGRVKSTLNAVDVDPSGAVVNDVLSFDGEKWVASDLADFGVATVAGTTNEVEVSSGFGHVTIGLPDDVIVGGTLTVTGSLTVNGTSTTINSETLTVDDPIIYVGGDTAPTTDNNKDRGVAFRWHNGVSAKTGFFGFDDSTGSFTFVPDATITSEVVSGSKGTLDATVDWSNVASKPDPVVTVTLTGAVTGSGSATLTDLASGTASFATTLATVSTADIVSLSALNIDGGTDVGTDLADADLIIVDQGGAGVNRKSAASRIPVYTFGKVSGDVTVNSSGVAAIASDVIVNADVKSDAAIVDTKLATISTADKVSLSALNIDGGTSVASVGDTDLFIVDSGGAGTNRKVASTAISNFAFNKISGDLTVASGGAATVNTTPSGMIIPFAGISVPTGYLWANGQSVSRTTYATLFTALTATVGTCTITTASPAVVSLTAHGLVEGDAIYFTTTGVLPTGLTANITYYVKAISPTNANAFQVSLSRTSSAAVNSGPSIAAGTAVNTTVAGSGTHTVVKAPYGVLSSSTFYVPDFRGHIPVGIDNIGGTDAGVVGISNALGATAGEVKHTLDKTELPGHTHGAGTLANSNDSTHTHTAGRYDGLTIANATVTDTAGGNAYQGIIAEVGNSSASTRIATNAGTSHGHTISGSTGTGEGLGYAHNVMQPFVLVNYIIKT